MARVRAQSRKACTSFSSRGGKRHRPPQCLKNGLRCHGLFAGKAIEHGGLNGGTDLSAGITLGGRGELFQIKLSRVLLALAEL